MKTPKEYIKNYIYRIITQEMIMQAAYSCSKRARNYRYNNEFQEDEEIENKNNKTINEFYEKKKTFLLLLNPDEIHEVKTGNRKKYYSYYNKNNIRLHNPIKANEIPNNMIPITTTLYKDVCGRSVNDLMSNQFINKLLELINSGNYTIID